MVIWYGNFLKPRVGSLHDAIFTATLVRRRLSYARPGRRGVAPARGFSLD